MKNYAYLDQYGIMHVVDRLDIAQDNSSGKVVETNIPNKGGYPCLLKEVVVYSDDEAYVDGNRREGKRISLSQHKEVQELYKKLKQ